MKQLLKSFAATLLTLVVVSCQQNYYIERSFDASQKSMNVPAGYGLCFTGYVKEGLKEQGWKLLTYGGHTTEKISDNKVIEYQGRGRYTMNIDVKKVDVDILTFQPIINLNVSVADNVTGEEILGYSAVRTKRSTCVKDFLKLIKENTK